MSLAEYLAKNYLTADPSSERPKKKRKKTAKADSASAGLIITDDDPPDLRATAANADEDEEDGPLIISGRSAEFRKAKKSGWKTVGGPGPAGTNETGNKDTDAADAIIAQAAAEREAGRDEQNDEDAPAIVGTEDDEGLRMESGAKGGLQTAEQTAAMVARQERQKKADAALYKSNKEGALAQETIYRDASGRIINVAMKRAEARKAEQLQREKEEAAREMQMGDVQRQERENRKRQLQEAKAMPIARTIEDEELNEEMRERQRWNDPAAQFLTKVKGPGTSVTGRPLYKGSFQPNRYGIRPGHRWDGVDRGNGFEKDWFASRNRKGRMEELEYQWQMDE